MAIAKRLPNSDSRSEFLITIEYLLLFTYDAKHATSQSKIVKYANEHYPNVSVRRDRIGHILEHLVQIQTEYPGKLPFKIQVVHLSGGTQKYYVSERMFSKEEIITIASAIDNDPVKNEHSDLIKQKFLDIAANANVQAGYKVAIDKRNVNHTNITKPNTRKAKRVQVLQSSSIEQTRITFTFKDPKNVDYDHKVVDVMKAARNKEPLICYIYKVFKAADGIFKVVFYISEYKLAGVTNVNNFFATKQTPTSIMNISVKYQIDNPKYASIDEWLEAHYSGRDGEIRTIKFKFNVDDIASYNSIRSSFEEYFGQNMPSLDEKVERDIPFQYVDSDGNVKNDIFKGHDLYVSVDCNLDSFRHWYMNLEILSKVAIVEPKELNDIFIGSLAERLIRRLDQYGKIYNYNLNKVVKEDYAEEIKKWDVLTSNSRPKKD